MGSMVGLVFAFLFIAVGFLGCFIHKFNGPLFAFLGIIIFNYTAGSPISVGALCLCALAVVVSIVLNKFLPKVTQKIAKFSKGGTWGSIIGSIIGLIILLSILAKGAEVWVVILITLVALVLLPFALSFLFEFIKTKNAREALDSAIAAYVTFLMGTLVKLCVCVYCVYAVIHNS